MNSQRSQSMTGFASIRRHLPENAFANPAPSIVVEMDWQSINSKYQETQWRADDSLRRFESPIRQAIREHFSRGRITVSLVIRREEAQANATDPLAPDSPQAMALLEKIHRWQHTIHQHFPTAQGLSVGNILRLIHGDNPLVALDKGNQGQGLTSIESILNLSPTDLVQWQSETIQAIMPVVEAGIDALRQSREAEAARILPSLQEKAQSLRQCWHSIGELAKSESVPIASRLREQIATIAADINLPEERMAQELALLAIRHDIREEIERLDSHLQQLTELLAGHAEALGKPLEFLLQEIGREVNTIASKTSLINITQNTLAMKHLIDQIREQAQNFQ